MPAEVLRKMFSFYYGILTRVSVYSPNGRFKSVTKVQKVSNVSMLEMTHVQHSRSGMQVGYRQQAIGLRLAGP